YFVLIVCIACCLVNQTEIGLGDVGISKAIASVSTIKLVEAITPLVLNEDVSILNLPGHLKEFAQYDPATKIFAYRGLLAAEEVPALKSICVTDGDKRKMEMLPTLTANAVGPIKADPKPVTCPPILIEAAERVTQSAQ